MGKKNYPRSRFEKGREGWGGWIAGSIIGGENSFISEMSHFFYEKGRNEKDKCRICIDTCIFEA